MPFRFPIRRLALSACILMAVWLSGCNKLRLGYEYADWLVIYSIEDNFDLEKAQRARLKDGVESYFRWHRKAMLPLYAELLSSASDSLARGMRPEGLDTGYHRFKVLYRKTLEPTVDRAVDFLMDLTPAQVEEWQARQQKKNFKLRKDFSGSREEQLERRYEKIVDDLEDWTGRLTKDQKRQIRALSRGLPWNGHLWLENREKVQVRLGALLKVRASREEVRRFIEDYFLYPERIRSDEYNASLQESEIKTRAMILRIHQLLSPRQRSHFRSRMDLLAQDFLNMSRQE